MSNINWDDYSEEFPFGNIVSVFSNKNSGLINTDNLYLFLKKVNLEPKHLITLGQVHSSNIILASKSGFYKNKDGILNQGGSMVCAIQVADCLPIFFVNRVSKTLGLIHAGWRGLSFGIISETIKHIINLKENISDYHVLIGPSIQSCCFEIKSDVLKYFDSNFYKKKSDNKFTVNLQSWAANQLSVNGIVSEKIRIIKKCTFCLESEYHSYRRDGSKSGRMFACIGWLK